MMFRSIVTATATLVLVAAGSLWAADCVDVNLELPATVQVLPAINQGYFELTNCGDEAATVYLGISIDTGGAPITLGNIPVRMGAGQTLSHEFRFFVPPRVAGRSFEFCITATSGTATKTDCAAVTVEGAPVAGGDPDNRSFSLEIASAAAAGCADVTLELPDTVQAGPASTAQGYFELTNCGDTAATVSLSATVSILGQDFELANIPVELGAGQTISRTFQFPIPAAIRTAMEVTICVTATSGDASSSSCQTVVILPWSGGKSLGATNYPNPFNPSTTISFNLPVTSTVSVEVFNLLGQKVKTLASNQAMQAGKQAVVWDGTDDNGNGVSSGVYFYQIHAGEYLEANKMLLTK